MTKRERKFVKTVYLKSRQFGRRDSWNNVSAQFNEHFERWHLWITIQIICEIRLEDGETQDKHGVCLKAKSKAAKTLADVCESHLLKMGWPQKHPILIQLDRALVKA